MKSVQISILALQKLASRPFVIGVVGTSRHYGGPEEGGWWYDMQEVLDWTECGSWRKGLSIARRFRKDYPTQRHPRSSVLGNGHDTEIVFTRSVAEMEAMQSTDRPHYE